MRCAACGTENRADRKFCSACGERLSVACPTCGASNLPGERFCGECGSSLDAAPRAAPETQTSGAADAGLLPTSPVAERRLVSVLFADLVGFTALAEERDPEAVREILSEYFVAARGVVERYAGSVEKFIGDAVMAVWGTPSAHEDDAERAVRAALELVDTVQALGRRVGVEALAARAAVLTGEAAVTIGARGEGMVAGDIVNTAARLQAAAEPGTVFVGEGTEQATRNAIAFEPAGDHAVRGKSLPVAAWRASHVVAGRRGAGRSDVVEAPFVGRAAELRALKDALDATGSDGRARFVGIVGQGGIGKSRLAWELEKYVDGLAATVYWHRGRSPAYGEGVAYWSLAEMVRERCRIAETDDAAVSGERLATTLTEYVDDVDERRWMEPHLRTLLGLETAASGERADQFAAWRSFFEAVARRGTTVLVFEDLQWADEGLLDFIDSLFEWSRNQRLLVVALARPDLVERRPGLGSASRNALRLHLEPLDDDEVAQLLGLLAPELPAAVVAGVVSRAGGIPLFAIELVRMLRTSEAERLAAAAGDIRIPPSLQAVVAARLDTLASADRALVHDAAVLGQTFTIDALSFVTGQEPSALESRLQSLVRREFLVREADPRSPERGQFSFVQPVVREVAYGTLGRRDRRDRHLAAARYFETLDDDEVAPVLAAHYLEAYRAAPHDEQARAVRAQARVALRASAERAAALHNYKQAIRELERGLELTDDPSEQAAVVERQAGFAEASARYEEATTLAQRARGLYETSADRAGMGRAVALLGSIELKAGHHAEAREHLEHAVAQLDPEQDADVYARVAAQIARANMLGNRPEETMAWAERALAAAGPGRLIDVVAEALNTRGVALQAVRRLDEGLAMIEAAIRIAGEHRMAGTELRARLNLAGRVFIEDPRQAIELLRAAVELAERTGRRDWHGLTAAALAEDLVVVGDWDEGLALGDAIPRDELPPGDAADLLLLRAYVAAARGDPMAWQRAWPEAEKLVARDSNKLLSDGRLVRAIEVAMFEGRLAEAIAIGERVQVSGWKARAAMLGARAAIWLRDVEVARRLRRQRDTTRYQGVLIDYYTKALDAGIAALEGRRDEALAGYLEAIRVARDLRAPYLLSEILLDACYALGPETPAVETFAAEARAIFESLGAAAHLDRLAEALRGVAPAREPSPAAAEAATG